MDLFLWTCSCATFYFCHLLQFELTITAGLAAADNRRIRRLAVGPRPATLGGNAGRADGMTATLGAPFTTAVRMVNRVHRGAADGRPDAEPPLAAGFAVDHVH